MAQPQDSRLNQDIIPLLGNDKDLYSVTSHFVVPKGTNIEELLLSSDPTTWSNGTVLVTIKDITKVQ